MSQAVRSLLLPALLGRLLPAVVWLVVCYPSFRLLIQGGPAEPLEIIRRVFNATFGALVISLFLLRHPRQGTRAGWMPTLLAFGGTFALLALTGAPLLHADSAILLASNLICALSLLWSIVALANLGRCFGIRPAARGLVTGGPYRLVRHPLYFGELFFGLGTVLPLLSPFTAFIWLLAAGFQIRRAEIEEGVLSAAFPAYSDYRTRTRFMIPFVW